MGKQWVEGPAALGLAIVCTITALAISIHAIVKHATHYNSPRTQKYIFRILGIIPVFSVCSVATLAITSRDGQVVMLTIRDVYEAFVVYSFFTLILEYAGGDYNCTEQTKHLPPVPHPFPMCCLAPVRRDAHLLRVTKQGVLQFVAVKIFWAVVGLAALAAGSYFNTGFQATQLVLYNTTYSIGLYSLLLFYLAIQSLLTSFRPVLKFLAVKAIVFATFWQSVLIYLLPGLTPEQAMLWSNFILCVECVPFAVLLIYAFPYQQFITGDDKRVVDSIVQMMNVGDVFQDAYHSFMPSYQDYVVARDDIDNPDASQQKTFRARTFLVGNLDQDQMKAQNVVHGSPNSQGALTGAQGAVAAPAGREQSAQGGVNDFGIDDTWASDVNIVELSRSNRKAGGGGDVPDLRTSHLV